MRLTDEEITDLLANGDYVSWETSDLVDTIAALTRERDAATCHPAACRDEMRWREAIQEERDAAHAAAIAVAANMEYPHPYVKDEDGKPFIQRLCPMDRNFILALTPATQKKEK